MFLNGSSLLYIITGPVHPSLRSSMGGSCSHRKHGKATNKGVFTGHKTDINGENEKESKKKKNRKREERGGENKEKREEIEREK